MKRRRGGEERKGWGEERSKGEEIPRRGDSAIDIPAVWIVTAIPFYPTLLGSGPRCLGPNMTLEKTQTGTLLKQLDKDIICHSCQLMTLLLDNSNICKCASHTNSLLLLTICSYFFWRGGGRHTRHDRKIHAGFALATSQTSEALKGPTPDRSIQRDGVSAVSGQLPFWTKPISCCLRSSGPSL